MHSSCRSRLYLAALIASAGILICCSRQDDLPKSSGAHPSESQEASTSVVTSDAAPANQGDVSATGVPGDAGSPKDALNQDAALREKLTKIYKTVNALERLLTLAKDAGVSCKYFNTWVAKKQAIDAWGNPMRGKCEDGKMVAESIGLDGDNVRFTEDQLIRP